MKDTNGFIDGLIALAKTVAPMVHPSAPAAIAAAEKVIDLIDKAKETFSEEDPSRLNAERELLAQRVRAHVEKTADKLRG